MSELGPNILQLNRKGCRPSKGGPLKFEHGPYIIDEDLSEIECGTCKEKLNPVMVLRHYAHRENAIQRRFLELREQIEKAKFKAMSQNRLRCEHCAKLTRIRKDLK